MLPTQGYLFLRSYWFLEELLLDADFGLADAVDVFV